MNIDLLSKMVLDIVSDNDKVTLPGLGCFIAEMMPASFSDKGFTINPPYRKLYFRKGLDSDSLLAELYAKDNDISVESADRILREFISGMSEELKDKKTIFFPRMGKLRATRENNIFFVSDEGLDIFPAGKHLEPISIKSLGAVSVPGEVKELSSPESVMKEDVEPPVTQDNETDRQNVTEEPGDDGNVIAPDPQVEEKEEFVITEENKKRPVYERIPIPEIHLHENREKKWIVRTTLLVILISILVILMLYILTAHIFPDFIDTLLYNEEELQLIHHFKI